MVDLPRARPEQRGVASDALAHFVRGLDETGGVHGYMVLRDGAVIGEGWWEPYVAQEPHSMYSVSKSFTSIAIGMAVAEGLLGIDDRVVDLLPDDAPEPVGQRLGAMRVRHLLTMTTGHAIDTVDVLPGSGGEWARAILSAPLEHEPGDVFVYNSGATYLLSRIVTRLTGQKVVDYLGPRLFEPLGISNPSWLESPSGDSIGGWGLSITTEELAAFAEFCRGEGGWGGAQLVPRSWIREATGYQVPTDGPGREEEPPDWKAGYGFQFWRSQHGYRGDGAFGQFAVVLPEQRMVIALTSGLADGGSLMNLIWERLLPGVDRASETDVPTGALRLPTPIGAREARALAGMSFPAPDREVPARRSSLDGASLDLRDFAGEYAIEVGYGRWQSGEIELRQSRVPIAAAGAWVDAETWIADVWLTTTPFRIRITLTAAELPRIDVDLNASFGPTEYARLAGNWSADVGVGHDAESEGWTLVAQVSADGSARVSLRG